MTDITIHNINFIFYNTQKLFNAFFGRKNKILKNINKIQVDELNEKEYKEENKIIIKNEEIKKEEKELKKQQELERKNNNLKKNNIFNKLDQLLNIIMKTIKKSIFSIILIISFIAVFLLIYSTKLIY